MVKNIFKFAWRNIWRNKRRTIITFLAVTVGVMTLIFMRSYINGLMNNATETMLKFDIGHIKIVHKEYLRLKRIMPREYLVPDLEKLKTVIAEFPEVTMVDPRLRFNVLLNHEQNNEIGIAVGIEPALVDENIKLSERIIAGRYLEGTGQHIIVGKKLADRLNAGVGDELLLVTTDINYSSYALPFRIAGIFETGYAYMDKYLIFIPIGQAQTMLDCGNSAHEVLLFIKDPSRAEPLAEKIHSVLNKRNFSSEIAVIPWQKDELLADLLPMMKEIWGGIMVIIMFIVGLVILNTMLMTVMERYHEIGVMKALGFKNSEVFFMILTEAFYIGFLGSVIGGAFGSPLSVWLEKTGIDLVKMLGQGMLDKFDIPIPMISTVIYPDFTLSILIGSVVFGIIVALIAVLYPALKSLRMSPVEAFRSELKV